MGQQAVDQMDIPIVKCCLLGGSRACIFVRRESEARGQRLTIDYVDSSNSPANLLELVGLVLQELPSYRTHTMAAPGFLDTTASNRTTKFKGSANTFRLSSCSWAGRDPKSSVRGEIWGVAGAT